MHGQMTWRGQARTGPQMRSLAWVGESAIAGLIGGMAMAMWSMIAAAIAGYGFWAPVRAMAAMFFGKEHAGGSWNFGWVVVGAALHMAFSMMAGVGYAIILGIATPRLAVAGQMVAGMVWGVVLWAVNTFAIGPAMPGGELMTSSMPAWVWFVGHLIFGMMLGLVYAWWRHGVTSLTTNEPVPAA